MQILKEKSIGHYAYFPSGITPDWPLCGMELLLTMIVIYIEHKSFHYIVCLPTDL